MKRLLTLITLLWFTPHIIPALADELSTGEYAYNNSGDPAIIGQCVMDHLFARNEFIDANGNSIDIDNIVSFKDNNTQLIWLWLDDDQIYSNQAVQALTPMAYNETGDLYSEITYSSCQFDIYLPGSVSLVKTESNQNAMWGDRLPLSSIVSWYKDSKKKVIDGIEYERYLVTIMGSRSYGSHFSGNDVSMYTQYGALKKDDAPLLGLMLQCNSLESELPDMIIANQEFLFEEAFAAGWTPNEYRFIYGTGGNNEIQRFQLYNRVKLINDEVTPSSNDVVFIAGIDNGTSTGQAGAFTIEKEDIKIDVSNGMANSSHYRIYKNETLTISSTKGIITQVVFECIGNDDAQYGPGCFTVNPGNYQYSGKIGTWTGAAENIVFTASSNQVRANKITVTLSQSEFITTPAPVIDASMTDESVFVTATGEGEVKLYKEGSLVNNPYIINRTNTDQSILFTATAQKDGCLISETASMTVIVPAKEVEPGEGYRLEKVWEINDLSFMTTTDVRQGFGMNDRYYINNKTNQTVLVLNENGLTETTYPGGTNCSLTRDEVGNIITCNTEFSFAWTEATIKVVNPKTNEMKEYTVPKKCGVLGRCDFIGFAKGNLMEDGALYLAGATNTGISVMTIADGEVSIDECYAATCDGLTPSSSTVINYYNDQTGEDALLYVTRNATPNANKLTALDDDHVSSTPVLLSGKGPSNGTFPFIWEGKEYFLYPYKAAGESNYLDGFAIAEADAEPIVVVPATVATPVNGFQCNWLNAEVNANSVTIYQYYPGGHITVYRLTDLSAPVIEKTDAPEIRSEVNEDYVEVTAIGKGNVILYVDDLIVDNPYYVSRSEHDFYVTASATAKEEGKLISETTTLEIFIPAKEVDPGETFIPKDVTVVPATTTADVTWEDSHNTGWNLRYREILPGVNNNLLWDFEEDTDDNTDMSLPGGWTCIDADGDGNEWYHLIDTQDHDYVNHSGIGHVTSASYVHTADSTGHPLTPDNWLVSPKVKIDGELSFWACGQDPKWASEVFRVYTSTDKVNWVPVSNDITATGEMTEYTFDLTPYACQNGYVAIRHYNVTDMFRLNVDDIAITYVKAAEWVYVENLGVPYYTIEGLTPGTNYEVQVQGINNYEVTSDWTESIQFTTFVLLGDVNGDGWVSITDLNAMLNIIFYDGAFVVAADMNKDLIINVQDVVGLVHYLLNGEIPTISSNGRRAPKAQAAGQACLYWQDGVLYLNSDVPVSALNIINDVDGDINWYLDDYGMVVMQSTGAQGEHSVIFSFDRSTIPSGVIAIATTNSHNPRVVGAELSNLDSELIPVNLNDQLTGLTSIQNDEMFNCHMDGSCLVINSGVALRDIDVTVYTIDGRVVANQHLSFLDSGSTSIEMSDIIKSNRYLIIVVRNGRQILATQKLTQNK